MLTTAQQTALAAAIAADQTLSGYSAANGFPQIADAMNATVASTLWLTQMPVQVVLECIAVGDMPTSAASLAYLQMMLSVPFVDASNATVRANFASLFNGKASLTALVAAATRPATRFEALFLTAASTSNTSTAYGMTLNAYDVQWALGR